MLCARCFLVFALAFIAAAPPTVDVESTQPNAGARSTPKQARIDPKGIAGTLVICGRSVPDQALTRFVELARVTGDQMVAIQFDSSDAARSSVQRLVAVWQASGSSSLEIVNLADDASRRKRAVAALKDATAVWLAAGDAKALGQHLADSELRNAVAQVAKRDRVLGCSGELSPWLGDHVERDGIVACATASLALLPDAIIVAPLPEIDVGELVRGNLDRHPSLIGYVIDSDAALIVKGRRLRSTGPGSVRVFLGKSQTRDGKQVILSDSTKIGDLTALRRAARDRAGLPFPPEQPAPPVVESGTVIAIGGDGMPDGIIDRFVELAGGPDASIVVLPTAMPDPIRRRNRMARSFRDAGAGKVIVLPEREREQVESGEYLEVFRSATGIWFGGGRQWRFIDAYLNTKVEGLMHDVLMRGGVIMGSSAGASIQAEYLVRGNPLGNLDMMADGYERGLGFLPGVAIDQHFTSRNRHPDMTALITRYPQILGIGIDGGTAMVVQGSIAKVIGKGGVHFFDARKRRSDGETDYDTVQAGGSYDLKNRKAM